MQLGQYNQAGPYSQYNNVPVVMGIPPHLRDHVVPFKILKEGILYRLPRAPAPAPAPAAPPLVPPVSQKRNREAQKDDDRPYIKKPPNAFMLFRKEQRPNVIAELNITESATVNTILGQRWQALSKEEQAKYFEEADRERRLHEQRYPDWSPRDNYGKKKKRTRTKDSTRAEASASKPDMVTQQAKKQCVTPVQTAAMASSTSQAAAMEAAHTWTGVTRAPTFPTVPVRGAPMSSTTTQTILVKLPDREIPFTLPVCNLSNLPPVNDGAEIASRHSAASAAFF
ncbi:transcription factor 7-like 1-B isoform X1 [Lates japonicus]|uniref:Transcription factor 7-like 1-B isoform X1 n=1 Tax=Lates japonicus TaxID=270547 RepID=A0AAD3NLA0_LATJO|nr:transcription factor 7-like 1-B isoform X1 [Lates japonicus]